MIENFVMYAMKNYQNPHCVTIEDFQRDLDKISYVNKLFYKYYVKDSLNTRLILNHIVILYNVFETKACTEMLFYRIKPEYWTGLKTFLTYLNYMPEHVTSVNIRDSDIAIDAVIAQSLRTV
jgi:hypothetical protein